MISLATKLFKIPISKEFGIKNNKVVSSGD